MSEKNYDFLEDIFTTLSNKWNAKDREVRINDSVRRDVDYLTYLITVLDGHNETRNMELDYTPFIAGYHYIIDDIKTFNNMTDILIRTYGVRVFTERPESGVGLNPSEFMEREHFFKACTIEYVRGFLKEMCKINGVSEMSIEQVLKQSIFWIFRLLVVCMFYMEESYVHHYIDVDDMDGFLDNFPHTYEELEQWEEELDDYLEREDG